MAESSYGRRCRPPGLTDPLLLAASMLTDLPSKYCAEQLIFRTRAPRNSAAFPSPPLHRRKVARQTGLGCLALAMAARQANRPHIPDVGFFRYRILTHRERTRYHRARALVTRISREVQVVFFHRNSRNSLTTALRNPPAAHQ